MLCCLLFIMFFVTPHKNVRFYYLTVFTAVCRPNQYILLFSCVTPVNQTNIGTVPRWPISSLGTTITHDRTHMSMTMQCKLCGPHIQNRNLCQSRCGRAVCSCAAGQLVALSSSRWFLLSLPSSHFRAAAHVAVVCSSCANRGRTRKSLICKTGCGNRVFE